MAKDLATGNEETKTSKAGMHQVAQPPAFDELKADWLLELADKDMLLSFNKEITAIRDREELLRQIYPRLKQLFQVEDIFICLPNEQLGCLEVALRRSSGNRLLQKQYNSLVSQPLSYTDPLIQQVMAAVGPLTCLLENQEKELASSPLLAASLKAGLKELVTVVLRRGAELQGVLMLWSTGADHFTERHRRLIPAVADQLSIAMSNVNANQLIEQQLKEISRYKEQLEEERSYLHQEVGRGYTYQNIIGSGRAMQQVFQQLAQVSFANSTVLLLGETGTGKEMVARALHHASPRRHKLMVKVNCASLPPQLVESELFGHEKGSFTGAIDRRIGKFELANEGTLFLDEVGELPLELQVKLLRALQEREIERVGGSVPVPVNVRVIAATNRQLEKEVAAGRFRSDLYYRLNVFPIVLPPLRERLEDIPELTAHFLEKYALSTGQACKTLSGRVMKELQAYDWPGNVRELEHLLERSILMTSGTVIRQVHLPEARAWTRHEELTSLAENERAYIMKVLNRCKGKIYGPGGAASILGLPVSTLNSRIKKLGIEKTKQFNYKP